MPGREIAGQTRSSGRDPSHRPGCGDSPKPPSLSEKRGIVPVFSDFQQDFPTGNPENVSPPIVLQGLKGAAGFGFFKTIKSFSFAQGRLPREAGVDKDNSSILVIVPVFIDGAPGLR